MTRNSCSYSSPSPPRCCLTSLTSPASLSLLGHLSVAMQQPTDSQTVTAHQQQHPADDLQQQEEAGGAQHGPGSSGSTGSSSQRKSWRQRVVAYSIRAIQAVLLLEVAAMLAQPLLAAGPQQLKETEAETDPADFDPCDILVDFFSGRRGITALQTLNNKQLRQAVDNMVTEDFQELGVKDRGAEIRDIVEEIIRVREEGPRPPREAERVGLGKLGPLRFRNSHPAAANVSSARPGAEQ